MSQYIIGDKTKGTYSELTIMNKLVITRNRGPCPVWRKETWVPDTETLKNYKNNKVTSFAVKKLSEKCN